jgi:hypothetical protein
VSETQRNGSRLSIPLALAIGLGSMLLTAGASWGVYASRIESVEGGQREHGALLQTHDRQITEVRAQYTEIIRRLDQIDRKLERQQ